MTNQNRRRSLRGVRSFLMLGAALLVAYLGVWQWMVCRIEVPTGHSLLLRYRGPWPFGTVAKAPEGTLVKTDASGRPQQIGILENMPGPGRHFYSPLEYETQLVKDTIIEPGKIGIVVSKVGKPLPAGTFLVDDEGYQGIRRKVLTPGRYRLNSYGYEVKTVDVDACVEPNTRVARGPGETQLIPPGYIGVVTNKTENSRIGQVQGIQDKVLQPGIYFLNPMEKRVDIISIGYNETTLKVEEARRSSLLSKNQDGAETTPVPALTNDPKYMVGKGIEFPSNDGFLIHLDFTTIWGILPEQAPEVVRKFGTLKDVEEKVILPQVGSICRLHGSKRGAVDLLVGDSREEFQTETAEELGRVLTSKNLSLLFGLTRHIYVPKQVREPIQKAKIANELTKTREQEQLTAKAQAELTEAKAKVTLEERRTKAETEKKVAELEAEGEKAAKEIEATTEKLKAEVDAKTATVEAESTKVLGEADAEKIRLSRSAEADRYRQYVQALGGPEAYNKFVFAEGLSNDLRLGIFYAGPGTLWTDLKGFEQTMLGKLGSESQAPKPIPAFANPADRAASRPLPSIVTPPRTPEAGSNR
ncbi:SPFH domain-containing protein [Singulisphaera sp. PoT]|uniref:SPFH domain-containing protein n=1 Tax=Singulisphaera sp. PoT TaxID=3411797 RepID=UPI003BF4CBCE